MIERNFDGLLVEEGITSSRVESISNAMDTLHTALSKCDSANRRLFFSKNIETRLKEYAVSTKLADVTGSGVKVNFCYVAPKDDKGVRVEVVCSNDPNRKALCDEALANKVPVLKSFPNWDEACIYAMKKNLDNGLLANDVSAIIASSDKAAKEDLVLHALSSVTKELINERVCRGLTVDQAVNCPAIILSDKAVAKIKADPVTKVVVQKNQDGEYRIPGPAGKEEAAACYTDDREDAIGTAKAMYGKDIVIAFRNVDEHYSKEDKKPAVQVKVKSR